MRALRPRCELRKREIVGRSRRTAPRLRTQNEMYTIPARVDVNAALLGDWHFHRSTRSKIFSCWLTAAMKCWRRSAARMASLSEVSAGQDAMLASSTSSTSPNSTHAAIFIPAKSIRESACRNGCRPTDSEQSTAGAGYRMARTCRRYRRPQHRCAELSSHRERHPRRSERRRSRRMGTYRAQFESA